MAPDTNSFDIKEGKKINLPRIPISEKVSNKLKSRKKNFLCYSVAKNVLSNIAVWSEK